MSIKLSVVIPCYNMGDFILETLNSVLSYPHQEDIEILIINDGSDDNGHTRSILDNILFNNVKIIHQENQGLGKARNNGIMLTNSPYIIPLDSDNKLRHGLIKKGISILDNNPEIGLVFSDLKCFGEYETKVKVGEFDACKMIIKNYIDACVVLRKSAWESIDGYDEDMPVMGYEDWDLNLRLFAKGWQFKYINEILFDYRVRSDSMLTNSNKNKELLLNYMFEKSALKQVKTIRNKLLDYEETMAELNSIKNRKFMKLAVQIERVLKGFLNLISFK